MDIKISMVMLKCAVDLAWLSPTHRCLRPGCNPVNGGSIRQHLAPRHQGTKALRPMQSPNCASRPTTLVCSSLFLILNMR